MKKGKFLKVFSSAMALSVILAGCSSSSNSGSKNSPKAKVEFKSSFDNGGSAVKDATLKFGILSPQPLTGLWNPIFADKAEDMYVNDAVMGGTFTVDEEGRIKQDNSDDAVKFHLDREKKEVTLTIHDRVKWNNGEDLTTKDIVASYELMGNPKFTTNTRYNDAFEFIEGMKEFHSGSAKTISGLQVKDDKTIVIKYTQIRPSLIWGEGFIADFLNAKQVAEASKDFAKFAEADLNKKPLSYGAYYIAKEVNGESILAEANPHFYNKDKVKLNKIEFKVVSPSQASSLIKNGDIDYLAATPAVYENSKDLKNGTFLGETSRDMTYVGFKLGKFDKEKGENVVDPNAKLADKNLRQAFLYAVDRDQINEKVYKGIRFTPTGSGMYPPAVGKLVNENATAVKKDVEKAKKLLDDAGYKDTDGDGLREDKNGKKLTFNFAIRNTGADYDQALADTFIKSWKDVGLDVKLVDGKLMSPKDFASRVQADDPSIDIFQAGWKYGTNPNRQELLGKKAPLNLYRYTTDAFEESFKKQATDEMFDDNKLKEAYNKFDTEVAEELPFFPLSWNTNIYWFNKRVKSYDLEKVKKGDFKLYELELTANEGAK
ncbi:ABC transporter, substrate-binding protein, family 5 [Gemella bergeri ATCC 700627]|uniref:ABC transporter, substrate-binding protein, family 5 n=1 Tax=Gemella bergeri ATCC 700627 TaxID=1321820 RepID=U2QIZ4_9BACL|nr:ABC transporter substrate-binding protein [Gemella bergeri]ERK56184.1 ABC transporter, substrate-binding protein, family 5 [Gemella bergeri ATCC 700627]